jgi:hypothetical protein
MKMVARMVVAPIAGAFVGLMFLFLLLIANPRVSQPGTVVLIFLYSVVFAILSSIYARWDVVAARIFAIGTSVVFFAPLAFLLLRDIKYAWTKIYPEHLALLYCYIVVGLASPLISLVSVQIVQRSNSQLQAGAARTAELPR